ncbi:glycoside hydrolase family 130 protein [Haloferula sp. A504]|uniref:glycoside hydrolase family 130 protein n=1 Tax=Haloferula sp. A504 TaxID=3373601 RepID=UPI0031C0CFB5|nr:glycoside hydrolase family 130 protein [Verrucomicrobiaceae bacterium E54]
MPTPHPVNAGINILPDSSRVIVRSFIPADQESVLRVIERAMDLSEAQIAERLAHLHEHFDRRHPALTDAWQEHYQHIRHLVPHESSLTPQRRLYLGALFSGEYALESAALFNPSITPHPDQNGLPAGSLRFIMSLRAVGEGHISSIAFRSGVVGADGRIDLDPRQSLPCAPRLNPDPSFRRSVFFRKLNDMEFDSPWTRALIDSLGDTFTRSELDAALRTACGSTRRDSRKAKHTIECIRWLATINYEVHFEPEVELSRRIIFPNSPLESNGIEDARFVRFTDDDGTITYYATYTAYNGRAVLPQLLETQDFLNFRARSLTGPSVRNKGMALFPRRIQGRHAMISRRDDENLYLMLSDDIHRWDDSLLIRRPSEAWEAVKIGNCGSPIETPAGWLLLTHGVGPMRRYCIGAMLLDLKDPSIVLGHLAEPLIEPDEPARDGYVPNVVYSCGGLVHAGKLVLPYGLNDTSTTITTIELDSILSALDPGRG